MSVDKRDGRYSEKDAGGGRWQPTVPAWLGEPTYILHVIWHYEIKCIVYDISPPKGGKCNNAHF